MALVNCPECKKEVSDSAASCPNCGYLIAGHIKTQEQTKRTELGKERSNVWAGVILLVFGVALAFYALAIRSLDTASYVAIFCSIAVIIIGVLCIRKVHHTTCPYCGKKQIISKSSESLNCGVCKKVSVKKGNYLETVSN